MQKKQQIQPTFTKNLTEIVRRMEYFIYHNQDKQFNTKQLSSQLNVDHSKLMTTCLVFSAIRLIEIDGRCYRTFTFEQLQKQNELLQQELSQKQFNSSKDQYDLTLTICCYLSKQKLTLEQLLSELKNQKLRNRVKIIIQILETIEFVNIDKDYIRLQLFYDQHMQQNISCDSDDRQKYISTMLSKSTPQSISAVKSLMSMAAASALQVLSFND